ncbi:MAG: peptidylprolyl isomerase, partial [Bacteroidetes bacterium QH_2_64_26]
MRLWLALLILLIWSGADAAAQPAPERPSDDLLTRPALQAVVRARAAFALASVQDTTAVPALLDRLKDSVPLVRTDAALALGQMPPSSVPSRPLLRALSFERDTRAQRHLIEALGKTGDEASLRRLLRLGPPPDRNPAVALTLARYGMRGITDSTATAWLVEHLSADDPWTRRNAAYAMGRVESLMAGRAEVLRTALNNIAPDDPAAMHLLGALGTVGTATDGSRAAEWLR